MSLNGIDRILEIDIGIHVIYQSTIQVLDGVFPLLLLHLRLVLHLGERLLLPRQG
jgi:hypothetical protein